MEGKLGGNHSGELHRETAEQKANRIIGEELVRRGWQESELAARHRTDPGKLAIAARLRRETTLPIKWIAARVKIHEPAGSWAEAPTPTSPAPLAYPSLTSPSYLCKLCRGTTVR